MLMQPMAPVYYRFYSNMWIMRRVTEAELQTKVPKYLTQEECDMIIATPQVPS
jgi:hypothetical protein